MGTFTYGGDALHQVRTPNRELLVEFCTDRSSVIANTLEPCPQEQTVTFAGAISTPTIDTFAMLDLVLVSSDKVDAIVTVSA